ncbi:hypothetical protein PI126_g22941, partial [Phytophthora idaei]
LAASANASLADEDKAPDVAMPGGRPKSDVWKLFDDTADGSAICQRRRDVMVNPRPPKRESHLVTCTEYTLVEKKKRKRAAMESVEDEVRRNP